MRAWVAARKERLSYVLAAVLLLVTLVAYALSAVELRHLKTANDQMQRLRNLGSAALQSDRSVTAAAFRGVQSHNPAAARRLRADYESLPASLPRFETAVDTELRGFERHAHRRYPVARIALVCAALASLLLMGVLLWQFLTQRRAGRIDRDNADRAHELARLRDEFVAVVSHELRTPLTSILGYIDLIVEDDTGGLSTDQRSYFEVVTRNANRLLYLVSDLLLVAESDDGRLRLDLQEVDLAVLLRDSVEAAQVAAERKHIELTATSVPARLLGDPLRLAQVLDNLISNAIKFTPDGGRVLVMVKLDGRDAVLHVRDSGIGMSPAERGQIFERFYRARTQVAGAGLGLAITKAIVDAHGGSIDVESQVGVGTTFRIRLPLPQPEATNSSLLPHGSAA